MDNIENKSSCIEDTVKTKKRVTKWFRSHTVILRHSDELLKRVLVSAIRCKCWFYWCASLGNSSLNNMLLSVSNLYLNIGLHFDSAISYHPPLSPPCFQLNFLYFITYVINILVSLQKNFENYWRKKNASWGLSLMNFASLISAPAEIYMTD